MVKCFAYFYNWEVSKPNVECAGTTRAAVTAIIDPNCTVGIAEHASTDLLTVFPNPASNFITIDLKYATNDKVEVRINDLTGKTVQLSSFDNTTGTTKQNLDVSNLAKGFYMINVKAGNQQWERKITIQ